MGRSVSVAVVLLLATLSMAVDAARTHESFSASSYYNTNETDTEIPFRDVDPATVPGEKAATTTTDTVTEPNRYPDGYPDEHHYNKQTNQYESVTRESEDPAGRYPTGYNTDSKTTESFSEQQHTGTSYTSTNSGTTTDPAQTNPSERYPHGYYPDSEYAGGHKSHQSGASYTSSNSQTTYDPFSRYPTGYPTSYHAGTSHPANPSDFKDQYTGESYTTTSGTGTTTPGGTQSLGERYPRGYYPTSTYTQGGSEKAASHSTSYSAQGNFNTLPYDNTGSIPFHASSSGCRSAYWVENVAAWPAFFNERSTVYDAFGSKAKETYGDMTMLQALLKYGTDPYSEIVRSATAGILNAYTRGAYTISHIEVIESFNAALVSKEAASAQAVLFETANVESISQGNACT